MSDHNILGTIRTIKRDKKYASNFLSDQIQSFDCWKIETFNCNVFIIAYCDKPGKCSISFNMTDQYKTPQSINNRREMLYNIISDNNENFTLLVLETDGITQPMFTIENTSRDIKIQVIKIPHATLLNEPTEESILDFTLQSN